MGKLTAFGFPSTESGEDNSVYDLFELAKVSRRQNGVTQVRGADPHSPAYKILNADLIPPVPDMSFRDLIDSIQTERGFILLLNLKQFKRTRGSILTVEKTDGSGPIFEIISNGEAKMLDVVLSTKTQQQVVSIDDADLATGHWQNITLFVQDDRVQLFVGCEEINVAEMDVPIYKVLSQELIDTARMRIAKGTVKDFKVNIYFLLSLLFLLARKNNEIDSNEIENREIEKVVKVGC